MISRNDGKMAQRFLFLFLAICLAAICSCATVPIAGGDKDLQAKTFQVKPDRANIYIYRSEIFGAAIRMGVEIDGIWLGDTGPRTYFLLDVKPGRHTIVSKAENTSQIEILAEAGKNYYVWQEVKMGVMIARSRLQSMDEAAGRSGIQECSLIELDSSFLSQYAAKERIETSPTMPMRQKDYPGSDQRMVKSDIDELPKWHSKTNPEAYAIVIGIEKYRQRLPQVDFAVSDARLMTAYLTKVMGYPEENVVTLINEHAAKSDFAKYFERWLGNNVSRDGIVFVYYSGHGAPNPKTGDAYLVPYDSDPTFLVETGYPLQKLYEALSRLPVRDVVVVLDSCFSGGGGRSIIAKGARPLVVTMDVASIAKNTVVLSASSGDQISSTYEEKGHGLFTYFMLKGIKNRAATLSAGGIDIGELFAYIKPQVERTARKTYNNEQSPKLIAPPGQKIYLGR